MSAPVPASSLLPTDPLHAVFLTFLPRVRLHARLYFRHVRCPIQREDCIAEVVALAWKWHVRLAQRGRDASRFVSALARFAARAVNSGRRVCGQEKAKDVLSETAQRRHGFEVVRLPEVSTLSTNPLTEALIDNTQTAVPEQAAFRIDFPRWRAMLSDRDQRMADALMLGGRTREVSKEFGLSPARVSQKRRAVHDGWLRFHGEDVPADPRPGIP